ncbi:MAG: T9SS type A sorting domain-containing protein, partial [Bacteroidales bacterium]
PNKRSVVTEAAITPMLERMNKDFAYFRDSLGWPPDKRAKRGYRSAIYLYGSGLCTDDEDSSALGGWQSSIFYENESWPMVLISYYPVYSFDPSCPYGDREYQTGAVVHEGIHSVLADLPGCKQAAWFHEGGNTWLQQEADARRYGDYSSMGWLNGTAYLAPFMPIECYSGWLQDDSFGGPSAEGVNMYDGGQQICTWRYYLGGIQYSNTFPTFLGQVLGPESIAWIWRYCPKRVLEGMAEGLGEAQVRRLIMEYRAKQALVEMNEWEGALKSLLNSYFKTSVRAEWSPSWLTPEVWIATPYARTSYDSITRTLTPEYRTTPGWSGANQVPLNVTEAVPGDTVIVDFTPLGANMTCQLCYRATDSTTVYSKPVSSGECGIVLEKEPANGIIIAVIANSDYIYKGEETRTAHYDYRLRLKKGILRKASIYQKWFNYDSEITDVIDPSSIFDYKSNSRGVNITVYPNPVTRGIFNVVINDAPDSEKIIRILNLQGEVLYYDTTYKNNLEISTINIFKPGIYLLNVQSRKQTNTVRLVVN